MKNSFYLLAALLLLSVTFSYGQNIITTYAGNGACHAFFPGLADTATICAPSAVATDTFGNVFIDKITDILKVDNSGHISLFAGSGTSLGDGGPADMAQLQFSFGVCSDLAGNVYIADGNDNRVRIVNTSNIINTFAGSGTAGTGGDNGQANQATITPISVTTDRQGNVYIGTANYTVRKVNPSGIITVFAGNGTLGSNGDNGPATSAEINYPGALATDDSGNLYIVDTYSSVIRKVNTSGFISTICGNDTQGNTGDNGLAVNAEVNQPSGIAVDHWGDVYIADTYNNRVRVINPFTGIITNFAGNGNTTFSGDNGPAAGAGINQPGGLAVNSLGDVFIGDANHRIRKVTVCHPAAISYQLNNSSICAGDSALLSLAGLSNAQITPSASVAWQDTAHAWLFPASGQTYTLSGFDDCGHHYSQQISMSILPAPSSTVNRSGDTLSVASAPTIQWYRNGTPISNATGSTYIAMLGGSYTVQVTGSNGCSATSAATIISSIQNIDGNISENIEVYPNPSASGSWQLKIAEELVGSDVEIFNSTGSLVYKTKAGSATTTLNPKLAAGIYLLRVISESNSYTLRIVKL